MYALHNILQLLFPKNWLYRNYDGYFPIFKNLVAITSLNFLVHVTPLLSSWQN